MSFSLLFVLAAETLGTRLEGERSELGPVAGGSSLFDMGFMSLLSALLIDRWICLWLWLLLMLVLEVDAEAGLLPLVVDDDALLFSASSRKSTVVLAKHSTAKS
jgi:hypothetical protein